MSAHPSAAAALQDDFPYEKEIAACALGDKAALKRLYQQESSRLLGVVFRIVQDKGLAEDLLHDTFMQIWHRADSFDPAKGTGRGWMYTIARHLALNMVRDHRSESTVDDETALRLDEQHSYEHWQGATDAFELKAVGGRMRHCLEHLEPARRACILYAYVDGCSHSEIAEKMSAPVGSVKAWIKRSLVALRECMA